MKANKVLELWKNPVIIKMSLRKPPQCPGSRSKCIYFLLFHDTSPVGFPSVVPRPAASASPGTCEECRVLGLSPDMLNPKLWGRGPQSGFFFFFFFLNNLILIWKCTNLSFLFIYLFILFKFLFVLGLRFRARAFSSCGERGATLHRSARASRYRGPSRCGAQAPDAQAQ